MSTSAVQRQQVVATALLILISEFGVSTSAKVLLTSNLEEDGKTAACPGDEVVFKCAAYSTDALAWRVNLESIVFPSCDHVDTKRKSGDSEFQGNLTGNSNRCHTQANMNSTLTVVAIAEHNGTNVKCTGTSGMADEMTLLVASSPPSPPQHFQYSTEPNTCKTSIVILRWEPPLSLGGASQIDSYTVNLTYTSDDGVDHSIRADTVEEEQIFPIRDALLYIAHVTAWNCIGESTAATQTIQTGCEQPSRPPRGYLVQGDEACTSEGSHVNFGCSLNLFPDEVSESVCRGGEWHPNPKDTACRSDCGHPATHKHVTVYFGSNDHNLTQEGSEIDYKCSTGYVPQDEWRSVCTPNGTWSPDPRELECKANCSEPKPPINGSLLSVSETTLEGSEVIYECNMGLIPRDNLTAVCTEDRRWHPDPAQEHCREQAVCGSVSPPKSGMIVASNGTLEGSLAVFACSDGFIPEGEMVTECMADGQWRPNPGDTVCQAAPNESGWNRKTLIVLCVTVPTATIFITASLVLISILVFIKRRYKYDSDHQQRTIPSALSIPAPAVTKEEPVYEDIVSHCSGYPLNLEQNTAYGEWVQRKTSDEGVQQCMCENTVSV